uniref:dynein regulatory complex protein 10 n=1 Tax=Semicossyphus pulcher TaxID=241346 RepID=UPI0037E8D46C
MSAKGAIVRSKTKTNLEKPLKSHDELSGKEQLSPEAQCISNILENCISQIEIAAILPALLQLNSVSGVVDKELSRLLQKHQKLAERLETLEGLRQESDEEQEGNFGEKRVQLEKDIKDSVRNLLRLVRAHPNVISGLSAEQDIQVGESESILIKGLKKFHNHVAEKLQTSVDEELELAFLNPVSSTPSHTQDQIVSKEETVATDIKEVDEMITEKNIEIKNLQSTLEEKKTDEAELIILANKQRQSQVKTSKMNRLRQEIDQLQMQLNNLIIENRQAERVIQEKNEQLETEIEYLLKNFDADVGEIQANLELNEMEYEKELEELRKQEKPFSVLEVEFNQIQEKHRLEEEKRKEEMRELELKTKAAVYAQAWWRGYSTRKALKNKGKGKKAKKGKGKRTK